jgi:hypothetical protein
MTLFPFALPYPRKPLMLCFACNSAHNTVAAIAARVLKLLLDRFFVTL